MNLQLRPVSSSGMVPSRFTRGRKFSVRGMGAGTCQVPQAGVAMVFPPCPASSPTVQSGGTPYVAPTYTAPPACSSSPDPNTSDSPACISLLLSTQQSNMQASNDANYNSDVGTCNSNWALNDAQYARLGLPRPPNTCAGNSFDLVPTGGYTGSGSDEEDASGNPSSVSAAAQVLAAEGIPVTPPVSSTTTPPATGASPTWGINPASNTPTPAQLLTTGYTAANVTDPTGATTPGVVASTTSPYLYWAIGGAAALLLWMGMK